MLGRSERRNVLFVQPLQNPMAQFAGLSIQKIGSTEDGKNWLATLLYPRACMPQSGFLAKYTQGVIQFV
jgi:hypothetical protein